MANVNPQNLQCNVMKAISPEVTEQHEEKT
jgi:hypothetical protein